VSSFPATATLTINGTSFNAGSYSLDISGTSGSTTHSLTVPFQVGTTPSRARRRSLWRPDGREQQV
jgi:hypothetical protein